MTPQALILDPCMHGLNYLIKASASLSVLVHNGLIKRAKSTQLAMVVMCGLFPSSMSTERAHLVQI